MACNKFIETCCYSGTELPLVVPTTGTYTMKFKHLTKEWQEEVSATATDNFTLPMDLNENAIIRLKIYKAGVLQDIDGNSEFWLQTMQCAGVETIPTNEKPVTFQLFYKDLSDDIELDGVNVDETNALSDFTTTSNVLLLYPYAGTKYNLEVFVDTGKYIEGFHYTYDRTTGTISFTNTLESSLVEVKFTLI